MYKHYKKLILIFVLSFSLIMPLTFASSVLAVDVLNPSGSQGACNNSDATSTPTVCNDNATSGSNPIFGPTGVLTEAIKIISWIIGVLAIIFIIVSGLRMVVSGGNPESVGSARNAIIYALVGLVVAAFAQIIVAFVLNKV